MGTLRIYGTIDVRQFWPAGDSDADTTKIRLEISRNAFTYREEGDNDYYYTDAFRDALSKGQGTRPVIRTNATTGLQTLTVRLEGIDAPELHFRAAGLRRSSAVSDVVRKAYNALNSERRQAYAESSTAALAAHLAGYADQAGTLEAVFETEVAYPFDAIDTYGRFIGHVMVGREWLDLNLWLVANGWALPAFYTSMSPAEIGLFLEAWSEGKDKADRPSSSVSRDANQFDWNLLYRKPREALGFRIGDDKGEVLMPKIFRRQTAWLIAERTMAIAAGTNFSSYLAMQPDQLTLLDDFLENGVHASRVYSLHDMISAGNRVLVDQENMVFREKPGTLVDAAGNRIEAWF